MGSLYRCAFTPRKTPRRKSFAAPFFLKDKSRGPVWNHEELCAGPDGRVDLPLFRSNSCSSAGPNGQPSAAVVAEDKPQGSILWVNDRPAIWRHARDAYAAGFSLAAGLRAGEVAPDEIAKRRRTHPTTDATDAGVEPSKPEPGFSGSMARDSNVSCLANQWAGRSCRRP